MGFLLVWFGLYLLLAMKKNLLEEDTNTAIVTSEQ
jgi:hypothetical protein